MNQTDAPLAGKDSPKFTMRRRAGAFALVLVCAVAIWWFKPNSALPPDVTILPPGYSIPAPPLPVPDRWIPLKWGWLWRVRYAVFGKPVAVVVETRLILFREPSPTQLQQFLDGRAPLVSSNGVRAWVLPDAEVESLGLGRGGQGSETHSARMSLGFGVLATMAMINQSPIQGIQGPVGDTVTYAVRKRAASVELTGAFTSTEVVTNAPFRIPDAGGVISLHTNLTLAARMQIPAGQSVFLYDTNRALAQNSGVGLLIRPKVR